MHTWLILIGLLVFLWLWFSSRGGATAQRGILSFGKTRAREAREENVTMISEWQPFSDWAAKGGSQK